MSDIKQELQDISKINTGKAVKNEVNKIISGARLEAAEGHTSMKYAFTPNLSNSDRDEVIDRISALGIYGGSYNSDLIYLDWGN